jgi:hypothetical protein
MRKYNLLFCITIILALILPSANAYNWCNKEGYQYCVEQTENIKGINITSRIAINLYDDTGDTYDRFVFSGFAIKGFYADIYYEGEQLYYVTNLTNWKEACNNETEEWTDPPCVGTILQTGQSTTIKLGSLHEEYIGCPLFISLKCDNTAEWCAWAGMGYIKPQNNTCPHIRITECYYDEDCLPKQYCNKTNRNNWKTWTCSQIPENITQENRTTRNNSRGYTIAKPKAYGYSPQYSPEDLPKSFFDTIVKIIRAIGNFFSGGR